MRKKNSILIRITSALLILAMLLTILPETTYAKILVSNGTGGGSIGAKGSAKGGATQSKCGYRLYMVDSEGNLITNIVDIVTEKSTCKSAKYYGNEPRINNSNSKRTASKSNKWTLGEIIYGGNTLPKPIYYSSGKFYGNGDALRKWCNKTLKIGKRTYTYIALLCSRLSIKKTIKDTEGNKVKNTIQLFDEETVPDEYYAVLEPLIWHDVFTQYGATSVNSGYKAYGTYRDWLEIYQKLKLTKTFTSSVDIECLAKSLRLQKAESNLNLTKPSGDTYETLTLLNKSKAGWGIHLYSNKGDEGRTTATQTTDDEKKKEPADPDESESDLSKLSKKSTQKRIYNIVKVYVKKNETTGSYTYITTKGMKKSVGKISIEDEKEAGYTVAKWAVRTSYKFLSESDSVEQEIVEEDVDPTSSTVENTTFDDENLEVVDDDDYVDTEDNTSTDDTGQVTDDTSGITDGETDIQTTTKTIGKLVWKNTVSDIGKTVIGFKGHQLQKIDLDNSKYKKKVTSDGKTTLYILLVKNTTTKQTEKITGSFEIPQSSLTKRVRFSQALNSKPKAINTHTFTWTASALSQSCYGHSHDLGGHVDKKTGKYIPNMCYESCGSFQLSDTSINVSLINSLAYKSTYKNILVQNKAWEQVTKVSDRADSIGWWSFTRTTQSSDKKSIKDADYTTVLWRGSDKLTIAEWKNSSSTNTLMKQIGFNVANSNEDSRRVSDYLAKFSAKFTEDVSSSEASSRRDVQTSNHATRASTPHLGGTCSHYSNYSFSKNTALTISNIKVAVRVYSGKSTKNLTTAKTTQKTGVNGLSWGGTSFKGVIFLHFFRLHDIGSIVKKIQMPDMGGFESAYPRQDTNMSIGCGICKLV